MNLLLSIANISGFWGLILVSQVAGSYRIDIGAIMSQLDNCLKSMVLWGVILYSVQSLLSPPNRLDSRHLSSCDTVALPLS